VSRAHHRALVKTYELYQVRGVYVLAEILTARDDRVCSICASLEGEIYTLDQVRDLIPLHPLCRCMILPVAMSELPSFISAFHNNLVRGLDKPLQG